jgi:hypothetical protein
MESLEASLLRLLANCQDCPFNTEADCGQTECQFRKMRLKVEKEQKKNADNN